MVARVKLAAAEPDNPKYAIKPEEQVAIQKQLSRMKQNTAPGLKITSGRTAVDHPDRLVGELMLREALATSDSDFLHGIMSQLAGAASSEGLPASNSQLNFMLSVVKDSKPGNQADTMAAAQMAAAHLLTMRAANYLANAQNLQQQESAQRMFSKLSRNYLELREALNRRSSSTEKGVTVQNVSIQEGGQAIVGNVTQNSPVTAGKTPSSPLAITDARVVPMPSIENRQPSVARSQRPELDRSQSKSPK